MRLCVDEDTASLELLSRLRTAGHGVMDPLRGLADIRCWRYAQDSGAAVLTMNVRDFVALAEGETHHGVLLIYRENDPTTDMMPTTIAAAVDRVAETYPDGIAGQVLTVNAFRW